MTGQCSDTIEYRDSGSLTGGGLGGSTSLQDLIRLTTPQVPQGKDGRQMLGARTRLALFPVVDRLRGGADQQAAFGS